MDGLRTIELQKSEERPSLRKINKVIPSLTADGEVYEPIKYPLNISALFWDRNSHGLFDYDA